MLDLAVHARLAAATAEFTRCYALAAAHTMAGWACRGLGLWSDALRPSGRHPTWQARSPRAAGNPLAGLWRLSPTDWMASVTAWPHATWLPGQASGLGWRPWAAWPLFGDWAGWSRFDWPAGNDQPSTAWPLAVPE